MFLPNEAEIRYLMDEDDSDAALQQVTDTMSDGLVALKQGRRGATVLTTDGDRVTVPALSLNPIDTTGAGDSFDAGFLFQYIQDAPLTDCLRYGSVCGGLSTTKVGGAAAAPTQQEVETWLSKLQS